MTSGLYTQLQAIASNRDKVDVGALKSSIIDLKMPAFVSVTELDGSEVELRSGGCVTNTRLRQFCRPRIGSFLVA